MKVCKVENLFGSNSYRCGKMTSHIITVDGINYLPFDFVEKTGFMYDEEDVLDIEYIKPVHNTKDIALAVAYEDIFGSNDYINKYDDSAFVKDGIKYLSIDDLRKTNLVIMASDIQEIEI